MWLDAGYLNKSELGELLSELRARLGVFAAFFDEMSKRTCERAAHAEAAAVQDVHGHLEAASHFAQHVLHRHWRVVEVNLTSYTENTRIVPENPEKTSIENTVNICTVRATNAKLVFWFATCYATEIPLHDKSCHLVSDLSLKLISSVRKVMKIASVTQWAAQHLR